MSVISRLGYLGFEVGDVAAWERFAVDVLGLLVSGRRTDGSLALRIDDQAQRIVIHPGARDDLVYAGFEVDDEAALRRLSEELSRAGFPTADPGDDLARARRVKRVLRGGSERRAGRSVPRTRAGGGALPVRARAVRIRHRRRGTRARGLCQPGSAGHERFYCELLASAAPHSWPTDARRLWRAGPGGPRVDGPGRADRRLGRAGEGMGVPAVRAEDADTMVRELRRAITEPRPHLIEAVL